MADGIEGLSPEEMQILSEMMGLDALVPGEQTAQGRLARGQGMMDAPLAPHSTGLGAALGGVGHILDVFQGGHMAKDARGDLAGLQSQRMAKTSGLINRLRGVPFAFDDAGGVAGAQFANEYGSGD